MSTSGPKTIREIALAAYDKWLESRPPHIQLSREQREYVQKVSKLFFLRLGDIPTGSSSSVISPNRFTANGILIEFNEDEGSRAKVQHFSVVLKCPDCDEEIVYPLREDDRDILVQLGEAICGAEAELEKHAFKVQHKPSFQNQIIEYLEALDHKLGYIAEQLTDNAS